MFRPILLVIVMLGCLAFMVKGQQQYQLDISAQNFTLNSEGKLTFDIQVQTENATVNSLQFINSTNSNYDVSISNSYTLSTGGTDYLYMPMDGSLEDKLYHTVKTYGTAALSGTTSATGTTSAFITNTVTKADYIEVQNVKNFVNEDFVVELWVYSTHRYYYYHGLFVINGLSNKLYVSLGWDGTLYLFKPTQLPTYDYVYNSFAPKLPLNTWVQLKIERKDNILSLYQNGQLVVAHSSPITTIVPGETVTFSIGKSSLESDNINFVGYIDNVRVYKPNENKHAYLFKATSNKVTNNYDATIYLSANTTYDFTPKTNIFIERPITVTYKNSLTCVHGNVINGKCECHEGYTGIDCSLSMCGWKKGQRSGTPTPTIESSIVNSNAIQFSVQVNQHPTIPFEHYLIIGESSFDIPTCSINGGSNVALTLQSSTECTKNYLSNSVTIDTLVNNEQVQKELMGDYIKLTVPLSIHFFNRNGVENGGFCEDIQYKTQQILYFKIYSYALAGFQAWSERSPGPFDIKIYTQYLTTTSTKLLSLDAVVQTKNVTVINAQYKNSTNPNYDLNIVQFTSQSNQGQTHLYAMKAVSSKAINNYKSLIYFTFNVTYDDVNFNVDVPLVIDYQFVTPPTDKNITLQIGLTIADSSWTPQNRFETGDRVYNLVESALVFDGYDLQVSDAFLCCFTGFVPTPVYNPDNNQFACTKSEANMNVWKKLIDNYSSKDLQTLIHPFSNAKNVHGFSFVLDKSVFTESKIDRTCYVQSFARLVNAKRNTVITRSVLAEVSSPNSINYFTIATENAEKPTVSQGSTTSINIYLLVILFLFIARNLV
ncbi:hypothetical protein ABK040_003123 [Willaertia magna]